MKNKIFIHFLNRELYRALGINKLYGVNYVLKFLLLSCSENMVVPLSSLWEGFGYNDLDYKLFDSMFKMQQIDTVSDCITLEEFLVKNRSMYLFDKGRYNDIYYEKRKILKDIIPTIVVDSGATNGIANVIDSWGKSQYLTISLPQNDLIILEKNKDTIIKINDERDGKAITASLFSKSISGSRYLNPVARFLSVYYIKFYCDTLDADIATNTINQIRYFDFISESFLYYDVYIISLILNCAGVDQSILQKVNYRYWNKLIELRACGNLSIIHRDIRLIIEIFMKNINYNAISLNTIDLWKNITVNLRLIKKHFNFKKLKGINCKTEIAILENNLECILRTLSVEKSIIKNDLMQKKRSVKKMKKKIFISHAHLDKPYAEAIVNLLLGIGIEEKDIICTSIPGMGVPLYEDIYDYLRNEFNNFDLHVIFILSKNYYDRSVTQNEMGAAWVLQKTYTTFLVPRFKFTAIHGAVNPNKVSIKLDMEKETISDLLNQLRDRMKIIFGLQSVSETRWEKSKNNFYKEIENVCGIKIV